MKSSEAKAAARRSESGVDRIGLPATVTIARICPSPGVSISSAMHTAGNSPNVSPRPRTRLFRRPNRMPRPTRGVPRVFDAPAAARVNIAPPGRSRLPVQMFSTSTSHEVTVPNGEVVVPMRAYTAADGAPARSRAMPRMVSASMPVRAATRSGANGATAAATSSRPAT